MKELLIKLRDSVEQNLNFEMGICDCVSLNGFMVHECVKLQSWLSDNLPVKTHYGTRLKIPLFCWEMGKKEPRLKWLDQEIKKM